MSFVFKVVATQKATKLLETMRQAIIGGPLLGVKAGVPSTYPFWHTFEPIVTECARYVLLPNRNNILVLSYKTGQRIATLFPRNTYIESVDIITYPRSGKDILSGNLNNGQFVLAGCSDGSIQEFSVADLESNEDFTPTINPRRVIQITQDAAVIHMTSRTPTDNIIYAVLEKKSGKKKTKGSLVRLKLPVPTTDTEKHVSLKDVNDSITTIGITVFSEKNRKSTEKSDSRPFRIDVCTQDSLSIVLIARERCFTIYVDNTENKKELFPIHLPLPNSRKILTSILFSPNGNDIACGYDSGEIIILTDIVPGLKDFQPSMEKWRKENATKKPTKPSTKGTSRKLHWHAHPVASLCYNGNELFSGGDESVLITWQLARGFDKPSDMLPRIALDGILKIQCVRSPSQTSGILVFSADNSLQLFEAHNKAQLWKVQGFSASSCSSYVQVMKDPLDHRRLVLTGMNRAPGRIHWYDPNEQRVKQFLEVLPYNRVSRTEKNDSPMPSPCVTHASLSQCGDHLLTVDSSPTENASVGYVENLDDGMAVGIVTTLRFWVSGKGERPYNLSAVMSYPHGRRNKITAAAISPNGKYACTISEDERAFRLWERLDSTHSEQSSPLWSCEYKVKTPAAFTSYSTGQRSVAFSPDSSLLAIGYGNMIALWNHRDTSLISTMRHSDDPSDLVKSIEVVDCIVGGCLVLTQSSSCVTLQTPFGKQGPKSVGWSWSLDQFSHEEISCSTCVKEGEYVAICIFNKEKDSTRVVSVAIHTGRISSLSNYIHGKVISITFADLGIEGSLWDKDTKGKQDNMRLALLTNYGNIVELSQGNFHESINSNMDKSINTVPTLPLLSPNSDQSRKRPRTLLGITSLSEMAQKKVSLEGFDLNQSIENTNIPGEMPVLHGAFVRAFIGRNLIRNDNDN